MDHPSSLRHRGQTMSVLPKVAPKPHQHKEDFKSATLKHTASTFYKAVNPSTLVSDNEYDYVNCTISPTSFKEPVASAVPLSTAIHTLQDQTTTLEHSITKLSTQMSALQSNLHHLSAELKAVCSEVEQLKEQVVFSQQQGDSSSSVATRMQEESPDIQRNKEYLSSLSQVQVLQLLEKMGLKQYKERFQEEAIDGEILLECDTEVLQDLNVTSRLHRVRLLKIISGQQSVQKILQGSITTLV